MADVVFVTPNFGGLVKEKPVGTLLLGTILRRACVSVEMLQFRHFGDVNDFETFIDIGIKKILAQKPKVVSFYTRCDTYHISIKLAQRLKQYAQDVYVVFGGPQADLSAEDTIREIPEVDFVCCGEGETTVVPLFSSLIAGKPDYTVCGLVYRKNGEIVKNSRPELIADLDELPNIDYSLLDFEEEKAPEIGGPFPVDVGRGCPFSCTFCSTKTFWGRNYRLKSAERIVEEIKGIHDWFGITFFAFEHDMFTMNRKKVLQTCQLLKKIGFPIKWNCSVRMDCIDEELINAMVDSGLDTLFVGIETGSPRMQKLIRKNLKLDDVPERLKHISEKGVAIKASFIFGFPEETDEDFSQTMDLMMQLSRIPRVILQHHFCTFVGGTEMTNAYIDRIERATVLSDSTGEIAVKDCEDLISAHPVLFPHYFEFKTEFRDKVKYYPSFFHCWNALRPVYEYIAAKYDKSRLCDMLYDFTAANLELLQREKDFNVIIRQDQFLHSFAEDEKYELLKEVLRFLLWKLDAKNGSRDMFGFDVKALLDGADVAQLKKGLCVVTYSKAPKDKGTFSVVRMK